MREMQDAIIAHEGCQLYGSLPVPRVAGNFHLSVNAQSFHIMRQVRAHVAPHAARRRARASDSRHVDGPVSQVQATSPQLNISHVIHTLSFGPGFPGVINPLEGFVRTTGQVDLSGTYKYFLKVRAAAAAFGAIHERVRHGPGTRP
jgi:hypothetical protein